jgi:hypothetical protein
MKTCMVLVKAEFNETASIQVDAESLFDAAYQAMQKWSKLWWFRPDLIIEVKTENQPWCVSGDRVRAWREAFDFEGIRSEIRGIR